MDESNYFCKRLRKVVLYSYQPINLIFANLRIMAVNDKFAPEDYYLSPEGYIIFTEKYHLKRGYCCQSNCKHCPWKNANNSKPKNKES